MATSSTKPCISLFSDCLYGFRIIYSRYFICSFGSWWWISFSDPFADASKGADDDVQDGLVHIRIQQRNGRKTLTTVQGLSSEYDLKKIVRACKKVGDYSWPCLGFNPSRFRMIVLRRTKVFIANLMTFQFEKLYINFFDFWLYMLRRPIERQRQDIFKKKKTNFCLESNWK